MLKNPIIESKRLKYVRYSSLGPEGLTIHIINEKSKFTIIYSFKKPRKATIKSHDQLKVILLISKP